MTYNAAAEKQAVDSGIAVETELIFYVGIGVHEVTPEAHDAG